MDEQRKRKRPDRAKKVEERANTLETVVKCSLQSVVHGYKEPIVVAINQRVYGVSRRVQLASVALNLLVREAFHERDDVTAVQLPEFWNPTFLRHLMLGTKSADKPSPEVTDLFNRYPTLQYVDTRPIGDSNLYTHASKKLSTNLNNHLVLNYLQVLKRYLYDCSGLSKDEVVEALYQVNGWKRNTKKQKKAKVVTELNNDSIRRVVDQVRHVLGVTNDTAEIGKAWFIHKPNLVALVRMFVFVNRHLEAIGARLINILPICRIKPHFITIDTDGLRGILKEVGYLGKNTTTGVDKELWDSVFNTSKVKGKNNTFTGTVDTDGTAINIHFRRPIHPNEGVEIEAPKKTASLIGKRVLGVDPGRSNILTVVEQLDNGRFKTYTLTRQQYYNDAGISKAGANSNRWNRNIEDAMNKLSENSPKSAKLPTFLQYVDALENCQEDLWNEAMKTRWREQRLRLYGGKKRVFSKFLNGLKPDENTILAFGSAKFAPGGKGEVSVPTTRAFKECSYRFKIRVIDEFRTSKLFWKDHSLLDLVAKQGKNGSSVSVRGLLWCGSTNEANKFVNRDMNAAINIRRCAMCPVRPALFDRKLATGKLEQTIGKRIKC